MDMEPRRERLERRRAPPADASASQLLLASETGSIRFAPTLSPARSGIRRLDVE